MSVLPSLDHTFKHKLRNERSHKELSPLKSFEDAYLSRQESTSQFIEDKVRNQVTNFSAERQSLPGDSVRSSVQDNLSGLVDYVG